MDGKYRKWDYEDHYYGVGMTALTSMLVEVRTSCGFKVMPSSACQLWTWCVVRVDEVDKLSHKKTF
jgi:hypothetical protein